MNENEKQALQQCTEILRQIVSGQRVITDIENPASLANQEVNELVSITQQLCNQYNDNYNFILDLSRGKLDTIPPPKNSFANPFKQLHSELNHLTWQIKEISRGDYEQHVSFSGDFSAAINKMVDSLKAKETAEDALRESELRFRLLFNDVPIPIAFIKKDGTLGDLNSRFVQIVGYANSEIPTFGKWWELSFPDPEYRNWAIEKWETAIDRAISEKADIDSLEYSITCKNGEKKIFEVFGIILWDGFLVCFFDITERKRVQDDLNQLLKELNFSKEQTELALIQKNQLLAELSISETKLKETIASKDKFFSIIAHDLKNPFIGLIGLSEILLEESKSGNYEQVHSLAKFINEASNNGFQLLMNLLEWSRLQTGGIIIEMQQLSLKDLVNETIGLMIPGILDKNITVSTMELGGLTLMSDKNILSTVLRNLLSNAIKYSNENGKITIKAVKLESRVLISIEDTGTGIEPGNIPKLFNIEANFTTKGTKNETGTGLGLILCKDFIRKLGGEIDVESELGKGTKFTVSIPVSKDLIS
jgi:PAS domain S-box-containing protein